MEHDIKASNEHTEAAEASQKHTWEPKKDEDGKWVDLPQAENYNRLRRDFAQLKSENLVQLDREPLLSWKPKADMDKHDKDYFVPNFGKDHDIKAS
jgi:hypothetical protein